MAGALLAVVPIGLLVGDDFIHVILAGAVAGPILAVWAYTFRSKLGFTKPTESIAVS